MQNFSQCTVLLHCTGNVPHKFVPVHIPVPVSASLTHLCALVVVYHTV